MHLFAEFLTCQPLFGFVQWWDKYWREQSVQKCKMPQFPFPFPVNQFVILRENVILRHPGIAGATCTLTLRGNDQGSLLILSGVNRDLMTILTDQGYIWEAQNQFSVDIFLVQTKFLQTAHVKQKTGQKRLLNLRWMPALAVATERVMGF